MALSELFFSATFLFSRANQPVRVRANSSRGGLCSRATREFSLRRSSSVATCEFSLRQNFSAATCGFSLRQVFFAATCEFSLRQVFFAATCEFSPRRSCSFATCEFSLRQNWSAATCGFSLRRNFSAATCGFAKSRHCVRRAASSPAALIDSAPFLDLFVKENASVWRQGHEDNGQGHACPWPKIGFLRDFPLEGPKRGGPRTRVSLATVFVSLAPDRRVFSKRRAASLECLRL